MNGKNKTKYSVFRKRRKKIPRNVLLFCKVDATVSGAIGVYLQVENKELNYE